MTTATLGLVGLGTMGANLARNFAAKGASLAVHDRDRTRTNALAAELGHAGRASVDLASLARHLAPPRRILLMVPAGGPVDEALGELLPHLAAGDIVIDGGNSFWKDTERRADTSRARGVHFVGLGVSGGEEGALRGPAMMAGGEPAALARIRETLSAIVARHDGEPCLTECGPGGAGHFVKMVHNGIEYAVMQLIAEAYLILRDLCGLEAAAIRRAFTSWQGTLADAFLVDCAKRALAARDGERALVDLIVDSAEQKGTGAWTTMAALEFGVPAPTLAEAVFARGISARIADRQALGAKPLDARASLGADDAIALLGSALPAASLVAHIQGFDLIRAAASARGWNTRLADIARGWRAGCILRSMLLQQIARRLEHDGDPIRLLASPLAFGDESAWRRVVDVATRARLPIPVFASALSYLDGYRLASSGANLIQGMRDVFGRHGFKRSDRPGSFHGDWPVA